MNNNTERVMIFIDGSNFYHIIKSMIPNKKPFDFNFEKFVKHISGDKIVTKVFYYVAPLDFETDPEKYWKHQRFLEMLRKTPKFNVVLCTLKKIKKKDGSFEFVVKGDDARLIHDFIV